MRFLQRYSLVQHGPTPALLQRYGFGADQIEGIYSPFFDALAVAEVPQQITCHDLTPLVALIAAKLAALSLYSSLPYGDSAHCHQPLRGRSTGGFWCRCGSD